EPPAAGADQAVSLAIPPAQDRDLQTKTMSLDPDAPGVTAPTSVPVSSDQLAVVDIGSARPRDVELDADAGKTPAATTITTGSGTSVTEPVIAQRSAPEATHTPPQPAAAKPKPVVEAPKPHPASAQPAKPAVAAATPATAPASTAASTAHVPYSLNLSAYASAAGAATLVRQVKALGYPVSSHGITQAGQPRTKVVAGPFASRAAAEAARLKITQSITGVPATLEQGSAHTAHAPSTQSAAKTTPKTTAKAGGWAVQLAAVSRQTDAMALRDKLRANGFDGFVDSVQVSGKQLWRVRAGPQTQRADAERVHAQIKATLGINGNVVSVP
ncbi:MAG: SPOR domain-containing protein, partial [Rhodanobacter sp.]